MAATSHHPAPASLASASSARLTFRPSTRMRAITGAAAALLGPLAGLPWACALAGLCLAVLSHPPA